MRGQARLSIYLVIDGFLSAGGNNNFSLHISDVQNPQPLEWGQLLVELDFY